MRTENTLLKAISTLCTQDREQAKDHLAQELRFSFFVFSLFSHMWLILTGKGLKSQLRCNKMKEIMGRE